jgi:DNA invertase Pin-like site-specific DNA recombinase
MGGERLDTRNPTSKLMLTILAGVATWEREIMLERQREGIAKAKAEGKYKGRPVSIDATVIKRLAETMRPTAIARQLGIARSSVYRVLGHAPVSTLQPTQAAMLAEVPRPGHGERGLDDG